MIGIIGAMKEEIAQLRQGLRETQVTREAGFTLHRGELEDKEVVITRSGIGKVNAAIGTQLLVQQGVRAVIFTGVAGATDPELEVGDIVVSRDALQHDLDVTALDYALGQVPGEPLAWEADPRLVELAFAAAKDVPDARVKVGRVVSGDQFIASADKVRWLRETFGAACAEMEGASTAQVCSKYGVPFVIIRSISDTADHGANVDFRAFTHLAAAQAERVVRGILRRL